MEGKKVIYSKKSQLKSLNIYENSLWNFIGAKKKTSKKNENKMNTALLHPWQKWCLICPHFPAKVHFIILQAQTKNKKQ